MILKRTNPQKKSERTMAAAIISIFFLSICSSYLRLRGLFLVVL